MQESKKTSRDERQEICRVKWIKNKCKGTLVQPTGCGKTISALKCLKSVINKYPNMRILVVVPTDNLKVQWKQQLDSWGMEFNTDVQIINTIIRRDWNVDEDSDIIIISKKTEKSLKKRNGELEIFKKIIGYNY